MQMLIDYLRHELERRQAKNARYSVRAFANSLGLEPSFLSKILSGKRRIGSATAKRILERLQLDDALKATLFLSFIQRSNSRFPSDNDYTELDEMASEAMSHWEFYAVLSLLELKSCRSDINWIASRLRTNTIVIEKVITELTRLGLVQLQGLTWVPTGKRLTASASFPASSLKEVHRQYIQKAQDSLLEDAPEARNISGMTMSIPRNKLPEAYQRIKEFRRALSDYLSDGESDAVYRLNIQFFPLTSPDDDK